MSEPERLAALLEALDALDQIETDLLDDGMEQTAAAMDHPLSVLRKGVSVPANPDQIAAIQSVLDAHCRCGKVSAEEIAVALSGVPANPEAPDPPVGARAIFSLWRNHPDTDPKDRWGPRAHRLARQNRDMLLAWAATIPDHRLLDCRNLGKAALAWIRANQPASQPVTAPEPPGAPTRSWREATPEEWDAASAKMKR